MNTHGNMHDRDIVLALIKSMHNNILVPGHVLGRHQDGYNAQCEDKITLANNNVVGGLACHK